MGIWDFSTIADANATADPSINFQEGQPANTVNNSARTLMQRLRFWADDTGGAIITGGTGNTYTATTSSVLPTLRAGLTIRVRADRANTGTVTLNVDGKGAKAWRSQRGQDVPAGAIAAGAFYAATYYSALDEWRSDFVITGTTAGTLASGDDSRFQRPLSGPRFSFVSATQCLLKGNDAAIRIGALWYTVPVAGVTMSNASFGANSLAYVYAAVTGGNLVLEASATGHSTDTTYGHEVKTGDPTRTLVGIVRTNASSQFADSLTQRFVLSYYNRVPKTLTGAFPTVTSASTGIIELATGNRVEFLTWPDEAIDIVMQGYKSNSGAGGFNVSAIGIDSTSPVTPQMIGTSGGAGQNVPISVRYLGAQAEGYHYATQLGWVGSGTGTWNTGLNGGLRG